MIASEDLIGGLDVKQLCFVSNKLSFDSLCKAQDEIQKICDEGSFVRLLSTCDARLLRGGPAHLSRGH